MNKCSIYVDLMSEAAFADLIIKVHIPGNVVHDIVDIFDHHKTAQLVEYR